MNDISSQNKSIAMNQRALRCVGMLGSGAIILSSLGLLLALLSFGIWPFETAAYWIPAYLLLGVPGVVICLYRRHHRAAVAGMACVAASLVMVSPHWLAAASRPAPPRTPNVRILQANVFVHSDNPAPLLRLIEETRPDIVVLQEVNEKWREMLAPLEQIYTNSLFAPRYPGGKLDLAKFWNGDSEASQELFAEGIPATSTVFTINHCPVQLLNVHTASPFTPGRARNHREQMRLLTDYVSEQTGPVVVAGDFNTGLWSWQYKRLLKNTTLRNARNGFGILGTWPSFLGPARAAIDHVLVSPEIEVIRCWTAPDIGSDHTPLLVDLYIE